MKIFKLIGFILLLYILSKIFDETGLHGLPIVVVILFLFYFIFFNDK